MILVVDTASEEASISFYNEQQKCAVGCSLKKTPYLSIELVQLFDALMLQQDVTVTDFSGIVCVVGPGLFTSVRIGVIFCNTMAFSHSIPLVGTLVGSESQGFVDLQDGKTVESLSPEYSEEPHLG